MENNEIKNNQNIKKDTKNNQGTDKFFPQDITSILYELNENIKLLTKSKKQESDRIKKLGIRQSYTSYDKPITINRKQKEYQIDSKSLKIVEVGNKDLQQSITASRKLTLREMIENNIFPEPTQQTYGDISRNPRNAIDALNDLKQLNLLKQEADNKIEEQVKQLQEELIEQDYKKQVEEKDKEKENVSNDK